MNPTNEQELSLIDAIVYQAVGDNEVLAATIKSNIQAYTNAEIASTLDRLCTQIINDYEPMIDSRGHTRKVVPVTKLELAIEAERAKLKEVK